MPRVCGHCGLTLDWMSRRRQFCEAACRQRAYRRRRQGLDERAYSSGPYGESARRGRVPMREMTRAEVAEFERLYGSAP